MAYETPSSPTHPHFFKPLLPGFHTHLSIPTSFFVKHVQGINEHIKSAKLRTDASDNTWLVKIDGLNLTDGWKDFADAHDLRIGDIIIFRHEGNMSSHVTPFGPSCCEVQYTSASSHDINDDSNDQTTNNTGGTWAMSSFSFDYCFLARVTASNLKTDKYYLPKGATRCSALIKQCQETILVNEEGESWNLAMRFSESGGQFYIRSGWRKFCFDNRSEIGDSFVFNVIGDGKTTPLLCVCPEKEKSKYPQLRRKSGDIASTSRSN